MLNHYDDLFHLVVHSNSFEMIPLLLAHPSWPSHSFICNGQCKPKSSIRNKSAIKVIDGALILDIMMTFSVLVTLTIPLDLLLALVGVIKIFFPQGQRNELIQNKPPMWMLYQIN